MPGQPYRGRFAPSPTGPLHYGSLIAAAASYLDARANSGEWLVRMEDLDHDRESPGAAEHILATLEQFEFEWDGPVMRQSERVDAYRLALEKLRDAGQVYPCACTRKEIADSQRYPGTCAAGLPPGREPRAWRVRTGGGDIGFDDRWIGPYSQDVNAAVGDFVVLRADQVLAYQLAVVVDDAAQRITDVVRGADLLDSTPRQIHLQRLLGLSTPRYLHVPVATDAAGNKLSKQTGAAPLDPSRAAVLICDALGFLGMVPPIDLHRAVPGEIWRWAIGDWPPTTRTSSCRPS